MLIDSKTVRQAVADCGVNKNTAFLWLHRFLKLAAEHKASRAHGIIEANETFFLKSFKGQRSLPRAARRRGGVNKTRGTGPDQIPVLVVRDRAGPTADFILKKLNTAHISQALSPMLDPDACLCTDCVGVYRAFAQRAGSAHEQVPARGPRRRGVFHINPYDSRLKHWMLRFLGADTK